MRLIKNMTPDQELKYAKVLENWDDDVMEEVVSNFSAWFRVTLASLPTYTLYKCIKRLDLPLWCYEEGGIYSTEECEEYPDHFIPAIGQYDKLSDEKNSK